MSKPIRSLSEAVTLSLESRPPGEVDASFKIEVEEKQWTCYTAHISERGILLYCNEGTAEFLVDSYGERHTAELYNWESEGGDRE